MLSRFNNTFPVTVFTCLLVFIVAGIFCSVATAQNTDKSRLIRQDKSRVKDKSATCINCHRGIEKMHQSPVVRLGCSDCHGGNPQAVSQDAAHVQPKYPDKWKSAANPEASFTLLNKESPEFIRFINPGDLRIASETCGRCHEDEVLKAKKSMMATSSLLWGGAAYNNGIVPTKRYILGESYTRDGKPQAVFTVPAPGPKLMKEKGILPALFPLPRWEVTQVANLFRSFERGGRLPRIDASAIGIPNVLEEPGKPDNKLGDRGLGTQLRISSPVLNIHKTRLNDPHMFFLGTNDQPGDYRSSGCTSCHVIYANDRSPFHSSKYAKYGNSGKTKTADSAISKNEKGHPIKHQFTLSIPSSQCMTCHMHQPNAFMNTFYGFQMWDYETDGELMYPKKQRYPSDEEAFKMLARNPEEAVLRGKWSNPRFLKNVSTLNPKLKKTQFADYHGHGWIFRAVFRKNRKGDLLDKNGKIIAGDSEHKFHGVVPIAGVKDGCDDPRCRLTQKAVHLKDIHLEKGMQCIDCHFKQDVHGDGNLYGAFHNAVEILCKDCHGTSTEMATLKTSGLAAPEGGTDLTQLITPFKDARFEKVGDTIIQRSMLVRGLSWKVSQVVDAVNPESSDFNPKAYAAKTMAKGGKQWQSGMSREALAHGNETMECQACHSSWVTNCFGCHLPQQANWKKSMNHYEGSTSRNWTTYNPQVVRDDGYMLARNASTRGGKITTARSSSALILSSKNANREQIYLQQPPISAPGFSSQAFNPHFSHTVRKLETRECEDCHVSEKNDNNAWMAQLFLHGTNFVNFMGKYAYVATGKDGLEAVAVTESDEPQAVIGSYLHKLAYPDYYNKHIANKGKLKEAYHHGSGDFTRSVQMRGEYLYAAEGEGGFRVYDIANIDNKGFSERIITSPVSPLGQDTHVKTRYATAVALPTNMPVDTRRKAVRRDPVNEEQDLHDMYSYAYITDKYEGLILVDVMNLVDGDPRNNFLKKDVTFNPRGVLNGATNLAIAGTNIYVLCKVGLVVVSVENPRKPKVVGNLRTGTLVRPRAIAVQFRYGFIVDAQGVKVIDITNPQKPVLVKGSKVNLKQAYDIYAARTYAYVAAGKQGLAIIDIEKPDSIFVDRIFNAKGTMNDTRGVKIASTNASVFAYVADGKNGLKVLQLTSPQTNGHLGFSPRPAPRLIAKHKTHGPALAISKPLDRDRAVDESGNQVSVFGRIGSRPFNLEEQKAFYLKNNKLLKVSNDYWKKFIRK